MSFHWADYALNLELVTKETVILRHIYKNSSIKQRELADAASLSLGMINAILRNMEKNGLIRLIKTNSRNMRYQLTETGIGMLKADSALEISEFNSRMRYYSELLEKIIYQQAGKDIRKVYIPVSSFLRGIAEYMCLKNRLELVDSVSDKNSCIFIRGHDIEELFILNITGNIDGKRIES